MKSGRTGKTRYLGFVIILAVMLAGCGGSQAEETSPSGEALFKQAAIGGNAGCATCHSLEANTIIVGPSLAGIGTAAGSRVEGLTAEEYIRQSITEPDAYLAGDYPPGIMPAKYAEALSSDELDGLVDYLLALK